MVISNPIFDLARERKPLIVWSCQPVASAICAAVAPSGRFINSITLAFLLPSLARLVLASDMACLTVATSASKELSVPVAVGATQALANSVSLASFKASITFLAASALMMVGLENFS